MNKLIILLLFASTCWANWCIEKKPVTKTRIKLNEGFYTITKRRYIFDIVRQKVPYKYTNIETYYDFVLERVCCFGYRQIGDTCEPNCVPDCPINSTCYAPNRCHCNNGYYGNDDIAYLIKCQPYCNEPCKPHAKCVAPNVCLCMAGYHVSNQSTCEPVCMKNCGPNAYCEAPNTCACRQNYKLIDDQCQPICENDCPTNSKCIEPNKCRCNENYQMKMTSLYEHYCEPICEPSCINGICTAPNTCTCYENYQMTSNGILCEPICHDGCVNGKCIAPDICECEVGYLMGPDNTCQPVCTEPCQMGQCIQPNLCKCVDGYTLKENSSSICEPICEPMCENGICVAPNFCLCHQNFTYADDNNITHICIPLKNLQSTTTEIIETENFETVSTDTVAMEMATDLTQFSTMTNSQEVTIEMMDYTLFTRTTTEIPNGYGYEMESTSENSIITDNEAGSTKATIENNCLDYCQCWQESGNTKPLPQTKCAHLCIDEYDQPCLNITLCTCSAKFGQLYCPNFVDHQNNIDYANITDVNDLNYTLIYHCKIWHNLVIPNEKMAKSHQSTSSSLSKWLWLICISAVVLIVTISLLIYWYTHKTNSNYMVQYDQGA